MKTKILMILSFFLTLWACGYEIIDSKPGEPIDPISNLDYTISGTSVILTWNLPSTFPKEIVQPVSVFVRVTKIDKEKPSQDYPLYSHGAFNAGSYTIDDSPVTFKYDQYDPNYTYRFIVKVMAKVDVKSVNLSNLRYSEGVVIEI